MSVAIKVEEVHRPVRARNVVPATRRWEKKGRLGTPRLRGVDTRA